MVAKEEGGECWCLLTLRGKQRPNGSRLTSLKDFKYDGKAISV
jgi:hypothetical protein